MPRRAGRLDARIAQSRLQTSTTSFSGALAAGSDPAAGVVVTGRLYNRRMGSAVDHRSPSLEAARTLERVKPLVVFDGDDTLWFVEVLYDRARASVASFVRERGLSAERWDRMQRAIDVENVARFGLSKERFPTSCVEAFEEISSEFGLPVSAEVRSEVYRRAASVFESRAELAPQATDVLKHLGRFADVVLLTKGDEAVQQKRIDDTGLRKVFAAIHIVREKTLVEFESVLREAGRAATDAWSVGNSLASDVNPALRLGMSAIWIDAHVWEHERRESEPAPGRLYRATALPQIVPIIEQNTNVLA